MQNQIPTREIYHQELLELAKSSNLDLVLVTDSDGLPLATSSDDIESTEIHAAVLGKLQNILNRFSDQINLLATSEVVIKDEAGKLFIIRPFKFKDTDLAIVFLLSKSTLAYKRSLNKLIRSIQTTWIL